MSLGVLGMDKWVADAGPFIHLDQIDHLFLLQKLPRLVIPASVVREVSQHPSARRLRTLHHWANVTIVAVRPPRHQTVEALGARTRLHRGEADCLHIALTQAPCILLTDDLVARTVAERLHLEVHGTVGLIVWAVKRKWLSLNGAEEALEGLYHRSRLFITYTIIERAIHTLRKSA